MKPLIGNNQPPTQALVKRFLRKFQIRTIHLLTLYSDKKGTIPVFPRKNLIAYDSLGRRLGNTQTTHGSSTKNDRPF